MIMFNSRKTMGGAATQKKICLRPTYGQTGRMVLSHEHLMLETLTRYVPSNATAGNNRRRSNRADE